MTRLSQSVDRVTALLKDADLAADAAVRELLTETTQRRDLDLSDLPPAEQAALITARSQELQPSADALAERIIAADREGCRFMAKFGIDPTGAEAHLGHTVPMLIPQPLPADGSPGGVHRRRHDRQDRRPFFDFECAQFRRNGDWLRQIRLPRVIEIAAQIPVSMPLQRQDVRKRLDAGQGLSLAELMYSVVMALDSVETTCDLEVGGIDQFLNMQMGRKVIGRVRANPRVGSRNVADRGHGGHRHQDEQVQGELRIPDRAAG